MQKYMRHSDTFAKGDSMQNLSNRRADISNIRMRTKNNQSSDERASVAMLLNGVGTKDYPLRGMPGRMRGLMNVANISFTGIASFKLLASAPGIVG